MKRKKVAFITGITGQDGSYLAELLLYKGYEVHGLVRRSSSFNSWHRIDHIRNSITTYYGDMTDPFSLLHALKKCQPDEIYNLAAQSHVAVSWETPLYTAQTTGLGILNLLEACRVLELNPKIYQASTSELYSGDSLQMPQNEETQFDPVSPYGTAKLYAFQIAKNYREAFGMFICNGILFNHESPRRGENFVTQKIVKQLRATGKVILGNIKAKRDWGYAPEYMEAAWRMLQQDKPDDYVIATGKSNTVKEFVKFVGKALNIKPTIIQDLKYLRPHDVEFLQGDPTKARKKLKWIAKVKGQKLADKMVKGE